jgi:hypothetical protein
MEERSMTRIHKLIVGMAVALVLAIGSASSVAAAAPTFTPLVIDEVDEVPADFCGFPVTAHVVANQTIKVFHDGAGAVTGGIVTGPWKVTYTTPTRSLTVALTGPSFLDSNLDLVLGTGRWVAFLPDFSAVFASGRLLLRDLDDLPLPTLFEADGHVVDWCGALAG